MKNVIVIGGGPAGMMAAVSAAEAGAGVYLLEKNEKLGKKLFITGKGRCNLTNACPVEEFFDNVVTNGKFIYSAVYGFTQADTCAFFEKAGLRLKEERGMRVFPASDKAYDVTAALERELKRLKVRVRLNSKVTYIAKEDGKFTVKTSLDESYRADAVIVATGGLSYQSTGSTGDGYAFAKRFGHSIAETIPSLVPLTVKEEWIKELEGLSLRNISIKLGGYSDFGEMLFTSNGVSGPVILSASASEGRKIAAAGKEGMELFIDMKPALSEEQLDQRILRDFSEEKNKDFRNSLGKLLPAKMIPAVVRMSGISEDKKVNGITKAERKNLVNLIKNFPLHVNGTGGFSQAVVTKGGVTVREINPSTMESKKEKGLFFAGEVMDVDAMTGGFNIQIALSTGKLAGESAAAGEE